jgi:hypothetical protein
MQQIFKKLSHEYHRSRPIFVLRATILLLAVTLLVVKRNFWTPDTLFVLLLVIAVVYGQARAFIIRFVPLIALLLAYDSFRGIADNLNKNVNFSPMIDADRFLFGGHLPTVVLQQWWWHGSVQWYDFYFYFLYTIHFLMPLLLAVLLWKIRDRLYWQFMWALIGLSFAAFITYVIFPAAPPWMASDLGYIEPLRRISSDIWYAMGVTNFSQFYAELSPNPVAAVPSLHSAYPLLFALFFTKLFGLKRTWWVYIYPVSIWIGVVYLGEHYVIDAILGALYAIIAYVISDRYFKWYYSPKQRWHRAIKRLKARLVPVFLHRS